MKAENSLISRFRRWIVWAVAGAVLLFVGFSAWAGVTDVGEALLEFNWLLYVPVLLLTLLNYGLRFLKWHYLLGRLGVVINIWENLKFFVAGLAMVISPGKAGEVLKPYLVRQRTGVPMATTLPALVTERLTDGIAVLALAGLGVSTYAGDRVGYVVGPLLLCAVLLAILSHRGLSLTVLGLLGRMPGIARFSEKLREMYEAMRVCVAPGPLVLTVAVSFVAWGAECYGFQLVLNGFGLNADLGVATFLYAFATVAGGAMPGGLGVADGALAGGSLALVAGINEGQAVAASLLIRVATLWLGEVLGAIALFGLGDVLGGSSGPEAGEDVAAST